LEDNLAQLRGGRQGQHFGGLKQSQRLGERSEPRKKEKTPHEYLLAHIWCVMYLKMRPIN
jgi:hypothetical protein